MSRTLASEKVPSEIVEGARAALRDVNGAKAVVLFGSRARGDHLPESDWDIAVVTSGGSHTNVLRSSVFDKAGRCGHSINCLVVPEKRIDQECGVVGGLYRGIVRDGNVLAGKWDREILQKGVLHMDKKVVRKHLLSVNTNLRNAGHEYQNIGTLDSESLSDEEYRCDNFVAYSSDAAERLAKVILIALGIDPVRSHDMHSLADQARDGGHIEESKSIRSLNGYTKGNHVAQYEFEENVIKRCRNAAQRLQRTMPLYMKTLRELPSPLRNPGDQVFDREVLETFKGLVDAFEREKRPVSDIGSVKVKSLLRYRSQLLQASRGCVELMERDMSKRPSSRKDLKSTSVGDEGR